MILNSPGEILVNICGVKIYYYGIIMALSVITGLIVCKIICNRFFTHKDFDIIYNLSAGRIICGFLGARIYYVLASYKYFSSNLGEIFAFRHGGLSIHGAIIGGLIFVISYLKIKKLPVLKYLDILSFGLTTGQIIGRWGNFFNSEAFGLPTFSWLKLYIPVEKRPVEFSAFDYFHPTFLYESLLNSVVLIILLFVLTRTKKTGLVFFTYILLYSSIRLFVEYLRIDSVLNIGGIPIAQIVSLFGIIAGLIGIFYIKIKNKV